MHKCLSILSCVWCIDLFTGQELWCLVKENLARLALDTGLGLETSQLASLPGSKLIVRSEALITNLLLWHLAMFIIFQWSECPGQRKFHLLPDQLWPLLRALHEGGQRGWQVDNLSISFCFIFYLTRRHKPVHTLPVYITCGAGPYLQFNDR